MPTDRIQDLEGVVDLNHEFLELEGVVDLNHEFLESGREFAGEDGPTAALDPDGQTVECWTCGSAVQRAQIESRLEGLREMADEMRERRDHLSDDIDARQQELREIERDADRLADLEESLEEVHDEIDFRQDAVEDLRERASDLRDQIADVEQEVEETEELRENDLVEAYRDLSNLQYEKGRREEERDAVADEIAEIERQAEERDDLERERDELEDRLADLRDRVETLERDVVEAFNTHMAELLDELRYDNVARVWIERKAPDGRSDTEFDLHVVREGEGGTVYEDSIDTLSESEREVIGYVVALAGYLVHDVDEEVPVVLLDSMESVDAERLSALLEYFSAHVRYLLTALLPEDADAVETPHNRIPVESL